MDRKVEPVTGGIRVELLPGTNEAVALDALVDDLLHNDVNGVLHELHEPHSENHRGHEPAK